MLPHALMITLVSVISVVTSSITSSLAETRFSMDTRSLQDITSTESTSNRTERIMGSTSPVMKSMKSVDILADVSPQNGRLIAEEEWTSKLFGERGLLSGIFRILDQQRKSSQFTPKDSSTRIDSNSFDFKKIVDALLMGPSDGEFENPLPELPEFLGLCDRLSCGDIYKAIDNFRRSELFSNFQIALSLIHDPNGWETIGNLLSNPELISQFTAGTEMGKFLGSALGQAKKNKAHAKEKNSKLTPEDGDFGTEFIDGEEKLPKVDFSIDQTGETDNVDYYEQVNIDVVTPVEAIRSTETTTQRTKTSEAALPEVSFSIDGDDSDSENENSLIEIHAIQSSTTKETWTPSTTKASSITVPEFTVTSRQTTRNHRKDSDYYAMYYND